MADEHLTEWTNASAEAALRATQEILQVISESRDDESPVFDTILRLAADIGGVGQAALILADAARKKVVYAAGWGVPTQVLEIGVTAWDIESPLVVSTAIREGRVVHVPDLSVDKKRLAADPGRITTVIGEGIRTVIAVPLMLNGVAIGCLDVYRFEVDPFSDQEIALLESFASQAVIAIENVRQFRELQSRLEREEATRQILHGISQSRDDEQPVFDQIVKLAKELCGAKFAGLVLGQDGDEFQSVVASENLSPEILQLWEDRKYTIERGGSLVADAILDLEVKSVEDMGATHFHAGGDERYRVIVTEGGIRSNLIVPLALNSQGIGCLMLGQDEVRPYTPDQVALVETFAAQAVIAIENVRQFREVQERLKRETATKNILRVISQSRDDETPVFDAILEDAVRLCGADSAGFLITSEDRTENVLVRQFGDRLKASATTAPSWALDAGHPHTDAVTGGCVVHVDDMRLSQLYIAKDPTVRNLVDNVGVRTALSIPLMQNGVAIGALSLHRLDEVKPFLADDIALLESFAAQAVIAIENVRQFREVQERLERERATKEVLSVISKSRDDETPVFDKILTLAKELCEAEMTTLMLVNPDRTALTYIGAAGTDISKLEAGFTMPIDDPMGVTSAARTGKVVNNPDLKDDDLYRQGHPVRVRLVDEEGIRSQLAVPLMQGDQAIGVLALNRREQKAFTADEVALIESFAAQAVIAIENVRQFREVQERLEREAATSEVLGVISTSRDDELPVFDSILAQACRLCDAPFAFLCLVDPQEDIIRVPATHGGGSTFVDAAKEFETSIDTPLLIGQSTREKRVINVRDLREEQQFRPVEDDARLRTIAEEGIRSVLYVPLISDGVGRGCIAVYRRQVQTFSDKEVKLIETFAAQAVIAIENVRQFRALETLNAELGDRVQDQVGEIERMGRLKRFLPSAVADAVVTSGDESMLTSHRAMVATLFCDMRGFTAFCEAAEPEETIEVLQTYHQEMSDLIDEYGGGVDQRAGDGIMVIFNDPIPVDDPAGDAVRLAVAMRDKMRELCAQWKRLGHRLGFGVGISLGYATVGMVGSAGRFDYTASGTSVNTAARLCDMAADGEVLISPRVWVAVEGDFQAESRGEIEMKGIREPVEVFAVG